MSWFARAAAEIAPAESALYAPHAAGYARDDLIGRHAGAVHTGFALCELAAGGRVDRHL
ncbi:MAG: hypothetical protein QOK36_1894, partial [Gaiellales bacterium]|nr:hypothetical protein [Gaiellales bacterium]